MRNADPSSFGAASEEHLNNHPLAAGLTTGSGLLARQMQ
jgi:hypothetical protein